MNYKGSALPTHGLTTVTIIMKLKSSNKYIGKWRWYEQFCIAMEKKNKLTHSHMHRLVWNCMSRSGISKLQSSIFFNVYESGGFRSDRTQGKWVGNIQVRSHHAIVSHAFVYQLGLAGVCTAFEIKYGFCLNTIEFYLKPRLMTGQYQRRQRAGTVLQFQ